MKAYHLLLVLPLSLALPLNGMAASQLSATPCQMQKDAPGVQHPGHMELAPDEARPRAPEQSAVRRRASVQSGSRL